MSTLDQLHSWKDRDLITAQQHELLVGLAREQPFSLFAELNILLYAGVLAFVLGLGWTVTTFSRQMGDVLVVVLLSAIVGGCLYHCFSRAPAWSNEKTPPRSFLSDYVLYLCCLVWGAELAYLEQRFHSFSGNWDQNLLATAMFFFFLAYRFDNRLVLSLALSSLAGWFGFTVARLPFSLTTPYRAYALSFCLVVGMGAVLLQSLKIKSHFSGTYLNLTANILFVACLSGTFDSEHRGLWFVALLVVSGASATWGVRRREFAFVAYAAVYAYVGAASPLLREGFDLVGTFILLITAAAAVLIMLIFVSRRFGRTQ